MNEGALRCVRKSIGEDEGTVAAKARSENFKIMLIGGDLHSRANLNRPTIAIGQIKTKKCPNV